MNKLHLVFTPLKRTLARAGLVSSFVFMLLVPPLTIAQANTVTLNFVNAEIGEVARAVAVMTGRNLVVDPRVRGNINMVSERPVSTSEAYDQFLTAVRLQGFTVVETSGIYKLVPEAEAKQQANTLIGTAKGSDFRSASQIRGNQIATQVFPLAYENANSMVGVLKPLMGPSSTINVNPSNNSLIITDYADNLQRVAKLIASQDVAKGTDLEIVPLRNANANDLAPLIAKLSESSGAGGANAPMILADTRSNSIILRAGNPLQLIQLRDLIQKLDREFQGGAATDAVTPGVYVIKLKNGEATKIATTLRSVLPQGIAAISQPGVTATSNVQIQADAATNSLIITAPDSQYRQLKAVIDKLDARPAQVFIESLIAEVNSDKVSDFGIQWQSALGQKGDGTVGVLGSAFGSGTSNIVGLSLANKGQLADLSPQGLNFGLFKKEGGIYVLGMLAKFLENTGDGNILATPNVLTLDNEESRVIVGQNVPFVTGQYTSTGNNSGVTNPFQTIERKDVGLTLRVKPQISENGAIRLKIYQESSSVDSISNEGLITNKRSIETNVIVDDGAIVVLGGLLDDRSTDTQSKVPLLGDIPGIGSLFKTENRKRKKTNLMIFLRPTIVRTEQETRELSNARYEDLRAQQLANQPSRHLIFDNKPLPVLPPIVTPPPASPATPLAQAPVAQPVTIAVPAPVAAPVVPSTPLKASSGIVVPQKNEAPAARPDALKQLFRNPGAQP